MFNFEVLKAHTDGVVASIAGVGTTLSLASTQPLEPNQLHSWLSYLPTIIGPALVVVVNRILAAKAAKRRVLAEYYKQEAEKKRSDGDPANDKEAAEDALKAATLKAEADAIEAMRRE
jgi:hypothetical protein